MRALERQSLRKIMLSNLMVRPPQISSPLTPVEKRRKLGKSEGRDKEVGESLVLVPTQWLSAWLREPERPPPVLLLQRETNAPVPAFRHTSDSDGVAPVILSLCPHGRISPDVSSQYIRAVALSGLLVSLQQTNCEELPKNLSRYVAFLSPKSVLM